MFGGNPAAVVVCPEWLPAATLQSIAAENNLAETAFVVAEDGCFGIRWFTPVVEVPLCGHATLASAYVLLTHGLAPGDDSDFVSRFFAPRLGVPEDPVTGSAHCSLVPFWARRLGRHRLYARQVSARGGELWCEDRGERVTLAGHAVQYLQGTITL